MTRQWRVSFRRWQRRMIGAAWERVLHIAWIDPRIRHVGLRTLFGQHFVPGTLALIPFADHRLLVDPSDSKIGLRLLHGKFWNRDDLLESCQLLERAGSLQAGGVFVDVGANIGAVTIYAMRSGYFSRGIAFEPDPHNFKILEQNIALNGLSGRVTLVQSAVGDQAGQAQLQRDQRNLGAHTIHGTNVPTPGSTIMVRQDRLDTLLERYRVSPNAVSFVKIDVEGHELQVLKGATALRARSVPMFFEYLGAIHGDDGATQLRELLASGYATALKISAENRPLTGHKSTIGTFDATDEEVDILAYRAGSACHVTPMAA